MRSSPLLLLTILLLVAGCKTTPEPSTQPASLKNGDRVKITKVVKGDELIGDFEGSQVTLRLLGIHCISATATLGTANQRGEAARDWVGAQVLGKSIEVTLGDTTKDTFGRHLVYATLDAKDFNRAVVTAGQGAVYTEYPFKREADYLAAEKTARQASAGLWQHAEATELITSLRVLWAETRQGDGKTAPADELVAKPSTTP